MFFRIFLFALCLNSVLYIPNSLASTNAADIQNLARFFGILASQIQIECPQQSFQVIDAPHSAELSVCLHKASNQKRCEIVIKPFQKRPFVAQISYDMKISHNVNKADRWMSIFQIHSPPDTSENWRCPPVSLEAYKGNLRMFNRWDKTAISKTSGYHCAEENSSIQSREIFQNYSYEQNQWIPIQIIANLTHQDNGVLKTTIADGPTHTYEGANSYNDHKAPYLKFGIYKPNGWHGKHILSCITYRTVDISQEK